MSDYLTAALPDRRRVAGFDLGPLTIGHAQILERIGSPLAVWAAPSLATTFGDVVIALAVMRRNFRRGARLVNSPWCLLIVASEAMALLVRGLRPLEQLRAHIREAWHGPRVFVVGDSQATAKPDPLRTVVSTLHGRMGKPMAEVYDMPLRQALWEVCGYWSSEGALRFPSEAEEAAMAILDSR